MNGNSRLPVLRNPPLPARQNARQPTIWQEAAPVVARGAALVAVGVIGEWLLRSLARGAFDGQRSGKKTSGNRALTARPKERGGETIAISETVIMTRKTIIRR